MERYNFLTVVKIKVWCNDSLSVGIVSDTPVDWHLPRKTLSGGECVGTGQVIKS